MTFAKILSENFSARKAGLRQFGPGVHFNRAYLWLIPHVDSESLIRVPIRQFGQLGVLILDSAERRINFGRFESQYQEREYTDQSKWFRTQDCRQKPSA